MLDVRSPSGVGAAFFSLMVLLTIMVLVQNTGTVRATLLYTEIAVPLALPLILFFGSGLLSGVIVCRALSSNSPRD